MPTQTHTIDNSQANICLCGDDWVKSSGFVFHITCEKKIQMNKKRNMHNQLSGPYIPLYTLVWCGRMRCVHNRIAIIIGSLVLWAFVICRLCPLSIIMLFCWSRLQWIDVKAKWLSSPSRSLDYHSLFSYDEIIKTRRCIPGDNFSFDHTYMNTIDIHKCENRRLAHFFLTDYI
jgi:hypothetical protein